MDNNNTQSQDITSGNLQIKSETIAVPSEENVAVAEHNASSLSAKIPRPRNAFILFRQHHHKVLIDEWTTQGEDIPHNSKISKILGLKWKSLPDKQRIYWEEMARKEKTEHEKKYPNYRYRPVRKHKKKQSKLFMDHTVYDPVSRHGSATSGNGSSLTPMPFASLTPTSATQSATPVFYRQLAVPRTSSLVGNFTNPSSAGDEDKWKHGIPPPPPPPQTPSQPQHQQPPRFTASADISSHYNSVPFRFPHHSSTDPIHHSHPHMPFSYIDHSNQVANTPNPTPNPYSNPYPSFMLPQNFKSAEKPLLSSIAPQAHPIQPPNPNSASSGPTHVHRPVTASVSASQPPVGSHHRVPSPTHSAIYPSNVQMQNQIHMQLEMQMELQMQMQHQMQFQHQYQAQLHNSAEHLPAVNLPYNQQEQITDFPYQPPHNSLQLPPQQPLFLKRPDLPYSSTQGLPRAPLGRSDYQQMSNTSSESNSHDMANEGNRE